MKNPILLSAVMCCWQIVSAQNYGDMSWEWQYAGTPFGITPLDHIEIDPEDHQVWYVSSIQEGLFITRDGGQTWEHGLVGPGLDAEGYQINPFNPQQIYAGLWDKLYLSSDKGLTWNLIYNCPEYIRSIYISPSDGNIYLGPQTAINANPGIYVSDNAGTSFQLLFFGVSTNYLICWDIVQDVVNNVLYVSTEIGNHPTPYSPPLFRLFNNSTWKNVGGPLGWHSLKLLIDPFDYSLYFLKEGGSLYRSENFGDSWQLLSTQSLFYITSDASHPGRLYGCSSYKNGSRGAWISDSHGQSFSPLGLDTLRVTSITLDTAFSTLYATCFGSGIWVAKPPPYTAANKIVVTNTADQGFGSLREAITTANRLSGPDTIGFAIPTSDTQYNESDGTWSIFTLEQLPSVTDDSLYIDGLSQREFLGYDSNPDGPEIMISGNSNNAYDSGLILNSKGNCIDHLIVNGFSSYGIIIDGDNASDNLISGCYIGTSASGNQAVPNQAGILINQSSQNKIGQSISKKGNIIAGNLINGIVLTGENCSYNSIRNNLIGLKADSSDLGNGGAGIFLASGANTNVIKENQIAYNQLFGIYMIDSNTRYNTISKNRIYKNVPNGLVLLMDANSRVVPPALNFLQNSSTLQGNTVAQGTVELFSDSTGQGQFFEATVLADAAGHFNWTGQPAGPNLTATVTDIDGNTSMLSDPIPIGMSAISETVRNNKFMDCLEDNYPNPFNSETTFSFTLSKKEYVQINIYNSIGQLVEVLWSGDKAMGRHEIKWDAKKLTTGIYFIRLEAGNFINIKKFSLLK